MRCSLRSGILYESMFVVLQVSYPLHDTDDETVKVSRVCIMPASRPETFCHRLSAFKAKHGYSRQSKQLA